MKKWPSGYSVHLPGLPGFCVGSGPGSCLSSYPAYRGKCWPGKISRCFPHKKGQFFLKILLLICKSGEFEEFLHWGKKTVIVVLLFSKYLCRILSKVPTNFKLRGYQERYTVVSGSAAGRNFSVLSTTSVLSPFLGFRFCILSFQLEINPLPPSVAEFLGKDYRAYCGEVGHILLMHKGCPKKPGCLNL